MIERSTLISNRSGIVQQLDRIWTKLELSGVQYLGDEANVVPNTFDTAELRVLFCRLSSHQHTRSSQAIPLLYQIVVENTVGIFPDRAYLPPRKDLLMFEKFHIPLLFGLASKEPARNFDVMAFSHAIIMEGVNLPRLLISSGIELMFSRRMEDEDTPIILIGGCNVRNDEYLFGDYLEQPHTGTGGFVDAAILGAGEETLPAFLKFVVEAKKRGLKKKEILLEMAASKLVDGLYLPWAYEEFREGKILKKVSPKAEYRGIVPDVVVAATVLVNETKPLTKDFISYIGQNGVADLEISRGCGVGSCVFCQEAMTERPYSQRSFEQLKEYYLEAKAYTGASWAGCYSFNWSSHTQIYELVRWLYKLYGKVSLISNRIDMINDNQELLKISYFVGNRHWATGIEGCSDRMRRALHKGAPEAYILKAVGDAIHVGFTIIKLFFIVTGREEPEDIQECCDMLQKIYDIKLASGMPCHVMMSFTPLFSKSHTPLQWQPVLPALAIDSDILRPLVNKCHDLHFGFRTSLRRSEIRIANLMGQGDRRLTPLIAKSSIYDDFVFYGNVPNGEPDKWIVRLRALGLDWIDFFRPKEKDNVFPWDHLSFGVPREWLWKRNQMWMACEEDLSCLGHRKIQEIDGVTELDAAGLPKWGLVKGKCEGCKACPSPQHIKDLSTASLNGCKLVDVYPVNTLAPFSRTTNAVLRFKYEIDYKHAGVPKDTWSVVIARAFMLSNPYALEAFNKPMRVTMTQLAEEEKQPIYGVDYADLGLTEFVPSGALDLKAIQQECRGITILGVMSAVKMSQFNKGDPWNYYEVAIPEELGVSMHEFEDALEGIEDRVFTLRKFEPLDKTAMKTVVYTLKGSEVGKFWLFPKRNTLGMRIHMALDPFQVIAAILKQRRFRVLDLRMRSFGAFRFSDSATCPECGEYSRFGMMGEKLSCECAYS